MRSAARATALCLSLAILAWSGCDEDEGYEEVDSGTWAWGAFPERPVIVLTRDGDSVTFYLDDGSVYYGSITGELITVSNGMVGLWGTVIDARTIDWNGYGTSVYLCPQTAVGVGIVLDCSSSITTGAFEFTSWSNLGVYATGFGTSDTTGVNPEPLPLNMAFQYIHEPERVINYELSPGEYWAGSADAAWLYGWTGTNTLVSLSESIDVRGTTYDDCMHVQTIFTGSGAYSNGTPASAGQNDFMRGIRHAWFALDVGLVRVMYGHADGTSTLIELDSYSVTSGGGYFPVTSGDTWTYVWQNGYQAGPITETCTVR